MSKATGNRRRKDHFDRPTSEQLRELHLYKIPREKWLERRKLAKNQVIDHGISMGFVRVLPDVTLIDLRNEINQQLQDEVLPDTFIFLKSVGRNFTQIKPNQELEIKAKHFYPPIAQEPEIYILEGSYISRMNSSVENSEVEEKTSQITNVGKKYKKTTSSVGTKSKMNVNSIGLPHVSKKVHRKKNKATENSRTGKETVIQDIENEMKEALNIEEENGHEDILQSSIVDETNPDSWVEANSNTESVKGNRKKTKNETVTTITKTRTNRMRGIKTKTTTHSRYKAVRGINKTRHGQKYKKSLKNSNNLEVANEEMGAISNEKFIEENSEPLEEENEKNLEDTLNQGNEDIIDNTEVEVVNDEKDNLEDSQNIGENENFEQIDEKITIEEKIAMINGQESDTDNRERGESDVIDHVRVVDDEYDEEELNLSAGSGNLKINVNAELINGDLVLSDEDLSKHQVTAEDERKRLLHILIELRKERQQIEKQRNGLLSTIKILQSKENKRKKQYQDEWKKRYLDTKKATPQLEEKCSKLKLELEKLHRSLLNDFETIERKKLGINGAYNGKPSQKTTYKIMISRLNNELDDLSRKVETAKVRLSTETKLRSQAEREVKVLRRDLTEKKIHVTLTKSQKFNNFENHKGIRLSAY